MPSFIWPIHYWMDLAAYPSRKHCCLWTSRSLCFSRTWITWHFSIQGLPATYITVWSRRLLPYVFTLISSKTRQLFSVALSVSWALAVMTPALNRYIALCCPDFPPLCLKNSDGPAGSRRKFTQLSRGVTCYAHHLQNGFCRKYLLLMEIPWVKTRICTTGSWPITCQVCKH